jgi:hypothetical protein
MNASQQIHNSNAPTLLFMSELPNECRKWLDRSTDKNPESEGNRESSPPAPVDRLDPIAVENFAENTVITDLFLDEGYDPWLENYLENEGYDNLLFKHSIAEHESEIFNLAVADFKKRFPNRSLQLEAEDCMIDRGTIVLYDAAGEEIGEYYIHVNSWDFPGRVQLLFTGFSDDV